MYRAHIVNFSLAGTQWDSLTTFLEKVGWDLTFDFNLFKRRRGMWDPTNAEQLLNYSASKNIRISGFELGNGNSDCVVVQV